MGHPAASSAAESPNSLKLFWQERPVKYEFPGGRYRVEEVKAPWDLFVEGRYFDTSVGQEFHQILVRNKVERIFSIRATDTGIPICSIITKPKDMPAISFIWGPRRVFRTSSPITIDKQELVVQEVIGHQGYRAADPIVNLAQDFFVAQGGVLSEEHPRGVIFTDKKQGARWKDVVDQKVKIDIMISTDPIKEAEADIDPFFTIRAPNMELALLLFSGRYWKKCYINGEEELAEQVIAHMEKEKEDRPNSITVYGKGDQVNALFARAKTMLEGGKK